MKIIFAADMSFSFYDIFGGKKAHAAMEEAAVLFKEADFGIVNLENVL